MPELLKMVFYLLVFAAVLYGAYYFSKLMASFQNGFTKSKYMKISDRLMLTKDKSIAIITIGEKNMLISITNDGINLIKEIEAEDMVSVEKEPQDASKNMPYNDALLKSIDYIMKYFRKSGSQKEESAFKAILNKQVKNENQTNDLEENVNDN